MYQMTALKESEYWIQLELEIYCESAECLLSFVKINQPKCQFIADDSSKDEAVVTSVLILKSTVGV